MPFGLSTAPAWASLVSAELTRMLNARGCPCTIAYLDDFFIIAPTEAEAQKGLDMALAMLREFNIEVAPEKVAPPSQQATILGIIVDTALGQLRVRKEHLQWGLKVVKDVLKKKKLSLKKTQSLAGVLNWICPMVKGSRPFMRGIWDFTKLFKHRKRTFRRRESRANSKYLSCPETTLADLRWWRSALYRLQRNNGEMEWKSLDSMEKSYIFSDASGDMGCGVWYKKHLFSHKWTAEQLLWSVPHKELFPIVETVKRFGHSLRDHLVIACTDSSTNVFALCAGSSTSVACNKLLKQLSRLERQFNCDVIGLWLPREFNVVTDQISKFKLHAHPLIPPPSIPSRD
jgi:hypothetical protein